MKTNKLENLKKQLINELKGQKRYNRLKKEYKTLIQELKDMKKIVNKEVYRNRWWLIRWLLK